MGRSAWEVDRAIVELERFDIRHVRYRSREDDTRRLPEAFACHEVLFIGPEIKSVVGKVAGNTTVSNLVATTMSLSLRPRLCGRRRPAGDAVASLAAIEYVVAGLPPTGVVTVQAIDMVVPLVSFQRRSPSSPRVARECHLELISLPKIRSSPSPPPIKSPHRQLEPPADERIVAGAAAKCHRSRRRRRCSRHRRRP